MSLKKFVVTFALVMQGVFGFSVYANADACPTDTSLTLTTGQSCTAYSNSVADVTINISNGALINGSTEAVYNNGTISDLANSGTITAYYGLNNWSDGIIINLTNASEISGSNIAILNNGRVEALTNSGLISAVGYYGIYNNGIIYSLTNTSSGTIGGNDAGIVNYGTINSLTNFGTIDGFYSVSNFDAGVIVALNNLQGAGNAAGALTYSGNLPTNYKIIINSKTQYGQLSVTAGSGPMNFGIYAGSKISNGTYTGVLSSSDNTITLNSSSGKFGVASWLLNPEGDCSVSCIWDLIISGYYSGPSTADTQQSLVNTASALQPIYTLQNSALANSFNYDCSLFGANGVCISAGGRNTSVQGANGINNTSALLIASYRLDKNNSRIGAYADQNLSMNNSGSTVQLGNNTPLIGLFGVWSERPDYTGAEVKISAAYGQKNTTITRQVVGDSEPGSGSSQLNSQGAQAVAKYGFGVADNTVVSPYVGLRYTQNNMGGYTEGASSIVTAPLTYSALNTNATTALAGVGARHLLTPKTTVMASVGVESDTNTSNGSYYGSNSSIPGLTAVNFNSNPVRTRPTASLGAYYSIEKNQQVGISGIYRQEPFQGVSTTSVFATYTIGL